MREIKKRESINKVYLNIKQENVMCGNKDIDEDGLEKFFVNYEKFKHVQEKQKMRGLNDYNLFTSLLDESDEVRLHSRFIYSLLNPEGKHFQGDLFLEKFISVVGLKDFGLDSKNATVYKEYEYIDLYITDGKKHIIIENKIFAGDQDEQISKYIEIIQSSNEIEAEDVFKQIYVLYLSLDRDEPSKDSIPDYTLSDNVLRHKKRKIEVKFKAIHYNREIMQWLDESQKEVENLTNLNQVIEQYKDVVLLINNKYKGKIMSLKEFLGEDINNWMIVDKVGEERDELLYQLFKELSEKIFFHIKSEINNSDELYKVIVLRKNSDTFFYSGKLMYLNIFLKNEIIIQLEYDSFFNIKSITTQFHKNETKKGTQQIVEDFSFNKHNDKKLYELLFPKDNLNLKHLLSMHDQFFMKKIDSIIDEYK